jgi:hypothetical protein
MLAAILPPGASGADIGSAVLEDYSNAVTPADLGFNDFSGNTGTINKDNLGYSSTQLAATDSFRNRSKPARITFTIVER